MPTQDKHSAHIRSAGQINSLAYKLTKTQQRPSTSTHQLTKPKNSSTHQLTKLKNSLTHQLTKVKLLLLFYNGDLISIPF